MQIDRRTCLGLLTATAVTPVFARTAQPRTLALLFDSLVSPFWVAAIERFRSRSAERGWSVLEAVSNLDDNRQYQQVQSMLQRGVDGIVIVHTDDKAVIPSIRAANAAGVPMVHFNRRPAPSDAYSVAVIADNRKLMDGTVTALLEGAQRQGGHYKAAILMGDLGDANAVQRRDGFNDAIARSAELVDVVARIATEWNADKAFSGLANALQAHPDINLLVTSSDFLTPQIEQVLRSTDKWHRAGTPGHLLIAGFDGDDNGYAQLAAGYWDVDGVQDLDHEVDLAFQAFEQMWAGARPDKVLVDPGFVIKRETLQAQRDRMWGYRAWTAKAAGAQAQGAPAQALQGQGGQAVAVPNGGTSGSGSAASLTSAAAQSQSTVGLSPSTSTLSGVAGGAKWAFGIAALGAFAHAMFSTQTFHDVLLAILPLAILAGGQLLVLLIGQIDLSMTAVMALGSVVSASVMTRPAASLGEGGATAVGIVSCLAVGALIGLFNGLCNVVLRVPSFIVTLAVLMMGSGAAVWYGSSVSDTISIGGLPSAFTHIGYGTVGGVSIALLLTVAALSLIHYMLSRTIPGRWVYAIGHNANVARISGVPVSLLTIGVFVAAGLCAALATIVYTSRIETGSPTLGQNMLLDIVGAAVIGGVSLFGGRGSVWRVLAGVAFLSVLDKSLQLLGLSLFIVLAIKGCAILAAALLDAARSRRWKRA